MQKENWQPYVNLFFNLSAWLAGPVILALLVGNWLDARYSTEPWGVLGLIGVAFIISNIGIAREGRRMMKQLEAEGKRPPATGTPENRNLNDRTYFRKPD